MARPPKNSTQIKMTGLTHTHQGALGIEQQQPPGNPRPPSIPTDFFSKKDLSKMSSEEMEHPASKFKDWVTEPDFEFLAHCQIRTQRAKPQNRFAVKISPCGNLSGLSDKLQSFFKELFDPRGKKGDFVAIKRDTEDECKNFIMFY